MRLLIIVAVCSPSVGSTLTFDVDLSTLTRLPLWEPTLQEYFADLPDGWGGDVLPPPVLLQNVSREEFFKYARKGHPIAVQDWSSGMEYEGWSCEDFVRAFPFGYMKAEGISEMPGFKPKGHDYKIIDGELRFNLGNFKPDRQNIWHNMSRPVSPAFDGDLEKPKAGAYVWHVKDETTPAEKLVVQKRFQAPPFLNDTLNSLWMNRSFEVWFSPGEGSGAGAHNDGYCESVVSIQLLGEKRWRMMLLPDLSFFHSFDEFDGGVYKTHLWKPDMAYANKQGGAIIWPPGYLHETYSPSMSDGRCPTSITTQFAFPQPVQYFRSYLPRLSLSSEVGSCVAHTWDAYVTFSLRDIGPTSSSSGMREQLDRIMSSVDGNLDGVIEVPEVVQHVLRVKNERAAYLAPQHRGLFYQLFAEDIVAYHDMNGDMVISSQELWDSLVQWNIVRMRILEGVRLLNAADREGLEELEHSLDQFRRHPIEFPTNLREELEKIFAHPKGKNILQSLDGVESLSETEFFSTIRGVLEDPQAAARRRSEL